jgi:hypothetical protein
MQNKKLPNWAEKRLAELKAAAPIKRKKEVEPFVVVPLWWIEAAAKMARSPTTLVLVDLLYAAWKAKSSTFPLPNGRLERLGVSRKIKYRVLRDLETGKGRLIVVDRRTRKTPVVTLTVR